MPRSVGILKTSVTPTTIITIFLKPFYQLSSILFLLFSPMFSYAADEDLTEIPSVCNPLSVLTCALPFPSDHYASENTIKGGVEITIPNDILPESLVSGWSELVSPEKLFETSNGYSALTPVLFELDDVIDINTLPLDGGDTLKVFDFTSGEEVPIRADSNAIAMSEKLEEPSMVIEGYPRSRWPFGNTMVAVVTNELKNIDGNDFLPSDGVMKLIDEKDLALAEQYEPYLVFLEGQGIAREDILSISYFTVRDEENVTSPLTTLIDIVQEQAHPVTITSKLFLPSGPAAAYILGKVRTSDFRQSDGHIQYTDDPDFVDNWVPFSLLLPRAALTDSVPIIIYGHGIGATKETGLTVIAKALKKGVAVIMIDQPYHGNRLTKEPYFLKLFNPESIMSVAGSPAQSVLDFHSLLKAVQTKMNQFDFLPGGSIMFSFNPKYRKGKGVPDIDTDQIYYMGTSLGGLFGTAFAATAPGLSGAYLEVTGAGINNALNHSTFFNFLQMDNLVPKGATGAEATLMLSLAMHRLDVADGLNFAHYFRQPPEGLASRPVALQYGIDDQVFHDGASLALAEVAELPIYLPALKPMDYLDTTDDISDGFALFQSPSSIGNPFVDDGVLSNSFTDLWSHLTFFGDKNIESLDLWIDQVIFDGNTEIETPVIEPPKPAPGSNIGVPEPVVITTPTSDPVPESDPTETTVIDSEPTQVREATAVSKPAAPISSSSSGGAIQWQFILMLLALLGYRNLFLNHRFNRRGHKLT